MRHCLGLHNARCLNSQPRPNSILRISLSLNINTNYLPTSYPCCALLYYTEPKSRSNEELEIKPQLNS